MIENENKNLNFLIILGSVGIASFLLFPALSEAGIIDKKEIIVHGIPNVKNINLLDIAKANWTVPLFLTIERDLPIGLYGLDTATSLFTTATKQVSNLGYILGDALSFTNSVARDIVIPSIISATKSTASVLVKIPKYAWQASKYTGNKIYLIGGKIYDGTKYIGENTWLLAKRIGGYVWDGITGTWKYVKDLYKDSEIFRKAIKVMGSVAVGSTIIPGKDKNKTDITDKPKTGIKTIPIGYLSKTKFDNALSVYKLYNPTVLDTRLATDNEAVEMSKELGYKVVKSLGYCAREPFKNAVPMIQLYNPSIIDSIITTNYKSLAEFKKIGYDSQGIIGYCKALT